MGFASEKSKALWKRMLASFKSSQSLANSVQLFCPAFAPDKEGGGDPFPPDGFFRKDPFRISRRGGIRPFHMVVPQLALGKPYRLPVLFRQEKGGARQQEQSAYFGRKFLFRMVPPQLSRQLCKGSPIGLRSL